MKLKSLVLAAFLATFALVASAKTPSDAPPSGVSEKDAKKKVEGKDHDDNKGDDSKKDDDAKKDGKKHPHRKTHDHKKD